MAWTGRKPDGTITKSSAAYLRAWRCVIRPLEDMGFTVHAFDPSFIVSADGRCTFELPLWAADLIIQRRKKWPSPPTQLAHLRSLALAATPGPWTVHERARTAVIGGSGYVVAACGGYANNTRDPEELQRELEANAALIAAAGPDILLALLDGYVAKEKAVS